MKMKTRSAAEKQVLREHLRAECICESETLVEQNLVARSLPLGRQGLEQPNAVDPKCSERKRPCPQPRVQMRVAITHKNNGMVYYELKRQIKLYSDHNFGLLEYLPLRIPLKFSLYLFCLSDLTQARRGK